MNQATTQLEPVTGSSGRTYGGSFGRSCLAGACLILVVGLLSVLPGLGSYGPLDPTDSFFLEAGREMVETGKYLLPLMNYEPWLDKPVMYFAMVAGAYKMFGVSPFVGRLPAALSAVATALIIFYGTRGLVSRKTSMLAAILFLALPLGSVVSHVCLTDMTLTACVAGATLFLWRGFALRHKLSLVLGYVFCALGIFCKGPICPILSLMALLPALVWSRRSMAGVMEGIKQMWLIPGLLLAGLANVPWYVAATMATGGKFFHAFFIQQNFGRMVGTVNHQMPFWFYIPVFFGGFAPFCLLTASAPGALSSSVRRPRESGYRGVLLLCLVWFVLQMVMFSVIKTKLPTYILPACPAFAILVAIQLDVLFRRGKTKWLLLPCGLMTAVAAAAIFLQFKFPVYLKSVVSDNLIPYFLLVGILCASVLFVWRGLARRGVYCLAAALMFACTTFVPAGLKAMYDDRQVGFNQLCESVRDKDARVAILMAEEPSMQYILHRRVERIQDPDTAARFMKEKHDSYYIMIPQEMVVRLDWFPEAEPRLVGKSWKWCFYELLPRR